MPLFVLPTAQLLHEPSSTFWQNEIKRRTYAGQIRQRADVSSRVNADGMQKLRGDDVVADLRRMLRDGFGVKRSSTQVLIHQAFIEAMLPKIYQGEWDENKGRILEEFGLKKLQQEVLIVMPRRRGKTYSVAMAAAAVILCVPGCSVAVFSTGERIAHALMKVVLSFIDKAFALGTIKKSQYRVGTSNK